MRDPTGQAADCKQHSEHIGRDTDRAHDDAAVEVHIRVQLAVDEIRVAQRDFLETPCNVEQRVGFAQAFEQPLGDRAQHLRTRVEVLVHAVPETHQAYLAVLALGHVHVFVRRDVALMDLFEHVQYRDIGPTVQRPPQRTHTGGAGGEQVRPA